MAERVGPEPSLSGTVQGVKGSTMVCRSRQQDLHHRTRGSRRTTVFFSELMASCHDEWQLLGEQHVICGWRTKTAFSSDLKYSNTRTPVTSTQRFITTMSVQSEVMRPLPVSTETKLSVTKISDVFVYCAIRVWLWEFYETLMVNAALCLPLLKLLQLPCFITACVRPSAHDPLLHDLIPMTWNRHRLQHSCVFCTGYKEVDVSLCCCQSVFKHQHALTVAPKPCSSSVFIILTCSAIMSQNQISEMFSGLFHE